MVFGAWPDLVSARNHILEKKNFLKSFSGFAHVPALGKLLESVKDRQNSDSDRATIATFKRDDEICSCRFSRATSASIGATQINY